ncbi:MAG: hypothetical protein V1777_03385 [Candidatus Micrarchaeota archaeon]
MFAVVFIVAILFLIRFDEYAGEFRKVLWVGGSWENLVYFLIFAFAIGYAIKWLVKKEFHVLFVKKRR